MIADGPGNCLTPEEQANVALLGQASGIAQLAAMRIWSVHSPCRMAEPPRGPNCGSGGFPQKRPPPRRHPEFGPADRNARWAIKGRAWLKRKIQYVEVGQISISRVGVFAPRKLSSRYEPRERRCAPPSGYVIPFGSPPFESRHFCGGRGLNPRSPTGG